MNRFRGLQEKGSLGTSMAAQVISARPQTRPGTGRLHTHAAGAIYPSRTRKHCRATATGILPWNCMKGRRGSRNVSGPHLPTVTDPVLLAAVEAAAAGVMEGGRRQGRSGLAHRPRLLAKQAAERGPSWNRVSGN